MNEKNAYADKTALIIEDTSYYQLKLQTLLKKMGVGNLIIAKDGLEGVRKAIYYKPDIVLLDLSMPTVDGFEACHHIRLKKDKFTMPVLVISGEESRDTLEKMYELGANDYFEKPINEMEVTNRIAFYLDFADLYKKLSNIDRVIENDVTAARDFMSGILPDHETVCERFKEIGYDFSMFYQPSYYVGGDFWTCWPMENGDIFMTIMDISGHGVRAAFDCIEIMHSAYDIFSQLCSETEQDVDVSSYMNRVNEKLCEYLSLGQFCVGAALRFEADTGKITYVATGLPAIKLFRCKGHGSKVDFSGLSNVSYNEKVMDISCNGVPLGISTDNFDFSSGCIIMEEGDGICIMSDGIIEAVSGNHNKIMGRHGRFLPGERLVNYCLSTLAGSDSAKFVNDKTIEGFKNNGYDLQSDDITFATIIKNRKS